MMPSCLAFRLRAVRLRTAFAALMLATLMLATLVLVPRQAVAQDTTIRGVVTDAADGEPLPGVNVVLFSADAVLVTGTVTSEAGIYALSGLDPGIYRLRVSYIGYDPRDEDLTLTADDRLILNISLERGEELLDEVLVEGDRGAGIARTSAGLTTILGADMASIPSPDVSGDLINYLTTLPGVVSVGDRGGQLYIRGGEPWQNLVMLDGLWVYQPFHVLGFFSSFPSDILSSAEVYAGGYPSQFGGRISSVIDVHSRNGNKYAYEGSVSLAPFVSGFTLDGPIDKAGRVSFLASVRESVIDQGASHLVGEELPYDFGDLYLKIHALPADNAQASVNYLRTHDRGAVFEGSAVEAPEEVRWTNEAGGLRYQLFPKAFSVLAEFGVNYSRLNSVQSENTPDERRSRLQTANTTADITHFYRDATVRWGLFARSLNMESEFNGEYQNLAFREEFLTEAGLYVEPEWSLENGWKLRAGLRLHSFPSKGVGFLEPRIRILKSSERDEWSLAAGLYHQEVIGLVDRRDAAGVFTGWTTSPNGFDVPSAMHLIVGYHRSLGSTMNIGVETYGKLLRNLFIPEWTAFPRFTTRLQQGDGRVVGADLKFEWRPGPFQTFLTYGLSSVTYTATQPSLLLWYGTDALDYRPPHDRRHQLNIVATGDVKGFDWNVRWQFGSGLPYSRAYGFDGFLLMDGGVDVAEEPGSRRVIFEKPYNGVLPTYHRLDASLERVLALRSNVDLTLQAGVINAYDRSNLFYLDVFTLRSVDQLPVIPTFGIKLDFE